MDVYLCDFWKFIIKNQGCKIFTHLDLFLTKILVIMEYKEKLKPWLFLPFPRAHSHLHAHENSRWDAVFLLAAPIWRNMDSCDIQKEQINK